MASEAFSVQGLESHSSLFEKLSAEVRRRLDQAIIDREPAGYRALFAKFDLAKQGVSFTAFYYYARRLRAQTDMLHVADLAGLDGLDVAGALPTLMAYRVFEAANDEDTSPLVLQRLVNAWRTAVNTHLALQRQEAAVAEVRRQAQEPQCAELDHAVGQAGPRRRAGRAVAASAIPTTIKLAEATKRPGTPRAVPSVSAHLSVPRPTSENQCAARPLAKQGTFPGESSTDRTGAPAEVQEMKAAKPTAEASAMPQATPSVPLPSRQEQGDQSERQAGGPMMPGSDTDTARVRADSGAVPTGSFKPVQAESSSPDTCPVQHGPRQADCGKVAPECSSGPKLPRAGHAASEPPVAGSRGLVQASSSRFKQRGRASSAGRPGGSVRGPTDDRS